jgi:hypothetical protein
MAEAGNPAVGKFVTAHAQSIFFPESAVWKLLPGWWGWAGDPTERQSVTAHAQNELFPWISCLETVTWLVRLGWRLCWMTMCLCACANKLFPWISCLETVTCWCSGEAGLATLLNYSVPLRMRKMVRLVRVSWRPHWMALCHWACAKWTVPVNQQFGNCYLSGEAGLATPLNDSVSLRMRQMNYSNESAVWKLLPGWWGWAGDPTEVQFVSAHARYIYFLWVSCL